MLTNYSNKLMRSPATKGPPPPDSAWGRCPACGAEGPITFDTRRGKTRRAVHGCRCLKPPPYVPIDRPAR